MTVAVFDLDETLTGRDSFRRFLTGYLRRHPGRVWRLLLLVPGLPLAAILPRAGQNRRTRIKQAVLRACLGGARREEVAAWSAVYAAFVADTDLRPGCLEALRAHQSNGDRVVLATASFDVYVEPLARRLGIEEVICSRVAWDAAGRLAGIAGGNCRDHEKLRRVRALLGDDGAGVVAYSDSHADLPLLAWAETGVAVSPTPLLAARVGELGLTLRDW